MCMFCWSVGIHSVSCFLRGQEVARHAYKHVGCFKDAAGDRVLGHFKGSSSMTTEVSVHLHAYEIICGCGCMVYCMYVSVY